MDSSGSLEELNLDNVEALLQPLCDDNMNESELKQESGTNFSAGELEDENWEWPDAGDAKDINLEVSWIKGTFAYSYLKN